MSARRPVSWSIARIAGGLVVACGLFVPAALVSQNRGVYPLGMSALNAGSLPDSGWTYSNQFLDYARDRAKDNNGDLEPIGGSHVVLMDMNTFTWVSRWSAEGFHYAGSATLPFARSSLTSDLEGPVNRGTGFGDSYYLPLIFGRNGDRIDVRAQYGFLAPTGHFTVGGRNNVGSGYWTHALSSGQTLHVARDRRLTLSAFEMYEIHTWQRGTSIRPGDTFDLDASLMVRLVSGKIAHVDAGAVGYAQRQTTARTGSGVPPASSVDRYAVNAAGAALSAAFPKQRANVAVKYFGEFANRATFEGYSLQVLAAFAL